MHALVLQSMGLPHAVVDVEGGTVIVVRSELATRARDEIVRYDRENQGWPPRERALAPVSQGIHAAIVFGGLMVLAYLLQHGRLYGLDWTELGRADAAAIRAGEWWRALTALTLHADLPHVAGNVVFGAVFGVVLAHGIGVGATWWAFLVTGGLGNVVNALTQAPSHRSIGASTAVFGLLGVQVTFEWMRRHELRYPGWRRFAPIVMGLGLWAWLGTGGASIDDPRNVDRVLERVDVLAHVWGFLVGAVLGVVFARMRDGLRLAPWKQAVLSATAALALVAAWAVALTRGTT